MSLPRPSADGPFPVGIGALVVLWGSLLVVGLIIAVRYQLRESGAHGTLPAWPESSAVGAPSRDRWSVMVCVHPACPCTAATLDILRPILEGARAPTDVVVVIANPSGETVAPESIASADSIQRLRGARVVFDRTGEIARSLGATTSGEAFLFRPGGNCVFAGGVTLGRGERTASGGALAIKAHLNGETAPANVPVFGCRLFDE